MKKRPALTQPAAPETRDIGDGSFEEAATALSPAEAKAERDALRQWLKDELGMTDEEIGDAI